MMPIELVNFWKRCDLAHAPFAHPDDLDLLQIANGKYVRAGPRNFDEFIADSRFWDLSDSRFHLSLLPIPYGGNLATADIVILMLNPSFTFADYYAEYRVPLFVERIRKLIAQDFEGVDFPFVWLDPQFCCTVDFYGGKVNSVRSPLKLLKRGLTADIWTRFTTYPTALLMWN